MNIITKERFEELCAGFVQHVFNDTQTKGWTQRRSALFAEHGFSERQYEDEDDEDEEEFLGTFQDIMMTKYEGDMDNTLRYFFCQGTWWNISRRQWFTCYCCQQSPEIKEMTPISKDDLIWKFNEGFKKWYWRDSDKDEDEDDNFRRRHAKRTKKAIENIKSVLGLDVCLK